MRLVATALEGVLLVEQERLADERGFFARTYDAELLPPIVQMSTSFNARAGTLRGLHFQRDPHGESKLVRCTRGAIFDVIVDLRPDSPTYRRWIGVELTAENRRMLYVPEGFAHGFQTLEDDTETFYQVSEFYAPGAERGLRWDDPAIGIEWPDAEGRLISGKDRSWPDYEPSVVAVR